MDGWRHVTCVCDCGGVIVCEPRALRCGHTKSCGCFHRDQVSQVCSDRVTHDMAGTPEYQSWIHMKGRCGNPKNPKYSDYGGRGISVCPEWETDFAAFLRDMGRKPSAGFSIERLDVNGNYSPDNCIWADRLTQARNRRYHRMVILDGRAMPLSVACAETGVNYRSALYRMNVGRDWRPLPPGPMGDAP